MHNIELTIKVCGSCYEAADDHGLVYGVATIVQAAITVGNVMDPETGSCVRSHVCYSPNDCWCACNFHDDIVLPE